MINMLIVFPKSIDPEVLDDLLSKLVPSIKQALGFLSLKVSEGSLMSPGGPPSYSKVVEASFESLEDFMAWTQTPTAPAAKDFMVNSGTIMLYYEVNEL